MSIRDWIYDCSIHGKATFSVEELRAVFPAREEASLLQELSRLAKAGIIVNVYRGFYVIVPPQYALDLKIPVYYYIDQLMAYLGKPYYLSLLTACVLWGSAHQRPQRASVMTVPPRSRIVSKEILWTYRDAIPERFLKKKNSETGTILYSNAELTAIDLVQYEKHIGGLSRAATVLSELVEFTDFSKSGENGLFSYTTTATLQRLGFILQEVLGEDGQADTVYGQVKKLGLRMDYCFLSRRMPQIKTDLNSRWRIYVNSQIEPDNI